jgi:hypothetical protein
VGEKTSSDRFLLFNNRRSWKETLCITAWIPKVGGELRLSNEGRLVPQQDDGMVLPTEEEKLSTQRK